MTEHQINWQESDSLPNADRRYSWDEWHCKRCFKPRALMDGLCDDCTMELYGSLCPWLENSSENSTDRTSEKDS